MAEGRVSEVVAEGDGLGEVLIEHERAGDGARDAGDFEGVGEAGAVVVAFRLEEDLGLVLEASEALAVDDSVVTTMKNNHPNFLLVDLEDQNGQLLTVAGFRIRMVD